MASESGKRAECCVIVEWTPRARRELTDQLRFIALDKPSAAFRMAELVEESTSLLRSWPELGKKGRMPDSFELIIARTPFVAVYRRSADRVIILRLFHRAQQIGRQTTSPQPVPPTPQRRSRE